MTKNKCLLNNRKAATARLRIVYKQPEKSNLVAMKSREQNKNYYPETQLGWLLMGDKNIAHKQPNKNWDGKQYKQTLPEKFHTNVFSIR